MNVLDQHIGTNFAIYNGDSIEVLPQIPSDSVDMMVFSPPFLGLYTYSNSERDLGNNDNDDAFIEQYELLAKELFRVLRPGRLCCVHVKDVPSFLYKDGEVGLRDFPGDITRAHRKAGFIYHSKVTIELDPVVEMQRTNAHGLLFKSFKSDSTVCRQGLPDYVVMFRKPGHKDDPAYKPVVQTEPVETWQRWANPRWLSSFTSGDEDVLKALAPVWTDINQTRTLNVKAARDGNDERHVCPLQLDTIERLVRLWSNPGEVVLSPFAGIGSEGYGALTYGRKFLGIELKESYYRNAVRTLSGLERAANSQSTLFDFGSK